MSGAKWNGNAKFGHHLRLPQTPSRIFGFDRARVVGVGNGIWELLGLAKDITEQMRPSVQRPRFFL